MGHGVSDETRERMRISAIRRGVPRGAKRSEQSRLKMSKAAAARWSKEEERKEQSIRRKSYIELKKKST